MPSRELRGTLALDGSKSISNRALIALALADGLEGDWLSNLSTSKDTTTLFALLTQRGDVFDAGDAGTTFRFLAAYLSQKPGIQTLTGSPRMLERPIGPLVNALRSLGADIQYLGQEGYPPLQIGPPTPGQSVRRIVVPANVSSQFLSALLLIAPYLPHGLELVPEGPLVSRPYLEMTVDMMRYFGADVAWQDDTILVQPGRYTARPLMVEADWSGASYWYAMALFAETLDLRLEGFLENSWQGDSVIAEIMRSFGIRTRFENNAILLTKTGDAPPPNFDQDFITCPDIAQTLAVACAGVGTNGIFTGLETLAIKETDRVAALQAELAQVGVSFTPAKDGHMLSGKASWKVPPRFATYGDHRMAMAFAAFGLLGEIEIENPSVVAKSYPNFWEHLSAIGFSRG